MKIDDRMNHKELGISGMAIYVPNLYVDLQEWCQWNSEDWSKVSRIVGKGFRMCSPSENVYTMAANAVFRLLQTYQVDASEVGFLGLGTESSTDNAIGAVLIKGMVNQALESLGMNVISRFCEVPEFKQACLGGIYALKSGLRYLLTSSKRYAIVVASDIAQYERFSTGEPTQGAGAVAFLLERSPTLLSIDIINTGSASSYRALDFRKPLFPYQNALRNRSFPLFNGKYSTNCYFDEILSAIDDFTQKIPTSFYAYLQTVGQVYLHRPYRRLVEKAWFLIYIYALVLDNQVSKLTSICELVQGIAASDIINELSSRDASVTLPNQETQEEVLYGNTFNLFKQLEINNSTYLNEIILPYLGKSLDLVDKLGNLYTASLPMWCCLSLFSQKHILEDGVKDCFLVGYGSGSASDVLSMKLIDNWREALDQVDIASMISTQVKLSQEDYEKLHDTQLLDRHYIIQSEFLINRVGDEHTQKDHITVYDERGIEFYQFIPSENIF